MTARTAVIRREVDLIRRVVSKMNEKEFSSLFKLGQESRCSFFKKIVELGALRSIDLVTSPVSPSTDEQRQLSYSKIFPFSHDIVFRLGVQ